MIQDLAWNYSATGNYAEASALYSRALEILLRGHADNRKRIATIRIRLGDAQSKQGLYAEAERNLLDALHVMEGNVGLADSEMVACLRALSGLYLQQGRLNDAEQMAQQALARSESLVNGGRASILPEALQSLALVYSKMGRFAEAERLMLRAAELRKAKAQPDPSAQARDRINLGNQLSEQGRFDEAEMLFVDVITIQEKEHVLSEPELGLALLNLGVVYGRRGRYGEAIDRLHEARVMVERSLGPDNPTLAIAWYSLGTVYRDQGNYREAESSLRRALVIQEKMLDSDHPDLLRTRRALQSLTPH